MHVLSVYDLDNTEAVQASINMRRSSNHQKESVETVKEAVSIVGGRLSYLSRVSMAWNMLEMADHLKILERGWLMSRIGLIEDYDGEVTDEARIIPQPSLADINARILAKMELMLLVSLARVRKAEEGAEG